MAEMKTLTDLFVYQLRCMYDGERRLVKALPELEEAASSSELKRAFRAHCEETDAHVERLEQVFGLFDQKSKTDTCEGVKGVVKDGPA